MTEHIQKGKRETRTPELTRYNVTEARPGIIKNTPDFSYLPPVQPEQGAERF